MRLVRLPAEPDAIAPDGSAVRVLAGASRGSMAVFELAAGETSAAVRHRTVEELWYFLGGRGEMWRRGADGAERVDAVQAGVSLDIPVGTVFQFRATGDEPLRAVGVTMPPWPGEDEAVLVPGLWEAHTHPRTA
jgi:mannose-6-phosphate isomerase-like protein (cupin superfamily)